MSFTHGGVTFKVAALSEQATRGNQVSDTVAYVARDAASPASAADALFSYYEENYEDLISFLRIDAEQINDEYAICTASVNQSHLEPTRFSTTGATTHLNQSLYTRGIYPAPGVLPPNYQGAIGVSDSGVEGVDITVPAFEFSLSKRFKFVSTRLLADVCGPDRQNQLRCVEYLCTR